MGLRMLRVSDSGRYVVFLLFFATILLNRFCAYGGNAVLIVFYLLSVFLNLSLVRSALWICLGE
jgi:hypothetical protein